MRYRASVTNGKGSLRHNRRDFYAENVDKTRTKNNVVLCDKSIDEAYQEAFGEAIEEYNKNQKQECRKLTVKKYRQKIEQGQGKENNPKLMYETIIQVGDMETAGIKDNPKTAEAMKEVLIDYFNDFQKRSQGHMVIVGAYIHMDEATPHLHIDWIPTARGYKKGMQVRNSLEKAMKEMGHVAQGKQGKRNNNRAMWQEYERNRLCEIAKSRGIEAIWEKHDTPEPHLDPESYRKVARVVERKAEEIADVIEESAARDIKKIQKMNPIKAAFNKKDIIRAHESVSAQKAANEQVAKAKYESKVLDLEEREKKASAKEQKQKEKDAELDARERAIQEQDVKSAKRQAMRDAELNAKDESITRKLAQDQQVRDDTARMLNEISTKEAQAKAYNDEGWEMYQDAMQVKKANEQERQALDKEKESLKPIQEANRRAEVEKSLKEQEAERADNNEYLMKKYRSLYEKEQRERAEDEANARRKYNENDRGWRKFAGELKDRAETAEAQNKADAETIKLKDQTAQTLKSIIDNLNKYINTLRNENYEKDALLNTVELTIPEQARLQAYSNQSEEARAKTTHDKKFPAIDPTPEQIKAIERQLSRPKGVKRHQSHGRDDGR